MTENYLTISEFAREAGVKPSFVSQLINDKRIPEARRDSEDNRYRIPRRRCVIPSKRPRQGAKINRFFYKPNEIPRRWVDDPGSRPDPGIVLEGKESDDLADRMRKTFGRYFDEESAGSTDEQLFRTGRPIFPELFLDCIVRVETLTSEVVKGRLVEINNRGVVLFLDPPELQQKEEERGQQNGATENQGISMRFIPWTAAPDITADLLS